MVQQQPDLSATSDKNQNYSRALWEKSPTAQVVLQADGTILDVNQAFVDLLDITPIKILGLNIWDLTSPADQADRNRELNALQQGGKFEATRYYLKASGQAIKVNLSGVKIELEENDLILTSVEPAIASTESPSNSESAINLPTILKVDLERELKQQAQNLETLVAKRTQELISSKARFEKLVINVPGVIYQFQQHPDGSFSFPYIGADCTEICEVSDQEIMSQSGLLISQIHPEDLANFKIIVQKSAETLEPKHWEGRLINPSGNIKWIQTASKPEKQADGSIVWDGLMMDISDRKQSEQDLRESQQLLRLVFDTLPQRIFWKDTKCQYLGCNKLFAQDAGLKFPEEIIGKNDFELSWHKSAALYHADDELILAGGAPKINCEESQTQADGTIKVIRTNKLPLKDKGGQIIGLFGSYEDTSDISEQKQQTENAQDFLEQAFDSINQPIFVKDTEHRWVLVNDAYCKFIGYSKAEILGKSEPDFYSQEQADIYWTKDELVMLSGTDETDEEPLTDSEGNEKILVTQKSCFQDLDGNTYLLGMIVDIYDA